MDEMHRILLEVHNSGKCPVGRFNPAEFKQAIWEVVERSLPKELLFGKDYDEASNCDNNYVRGHNKVLSDTTTALRKAILGEGK